MNADHAAIFIWLILRRRYVPSVEGENVGGYMKTAETVEWDTPKRMVQSLREEFGDFDLDPATHQANPTGAKRFFTEKENGLIQPWNGGVVYVNPPYGRVILEWVKKALEEYEKGNAKRIIMLLPSRTCTRWFHLLYSRGDVEMRFIKGRLKYGDGSAPAPFPSLLVVIGCDQNNLSMALEIMTDEQIQTYREAIGDMPE